MDALDDSRQPSDLEWSERRNGQQTQCTVAPPRMNALPVLVGAGVWDSFIVFFYIAIMRAPQPGHLAFLLFPLAHVLAGVYITWLALVKTLNSSRFTIDHDACALTNGPIWERGARFATPEIERFELRESRGNRRGSAWSIRVLTRDGKATRLSLPLDQRDHLGFVVTKLNAALAEAREPAGYRELA